MACLNGNDTYAAMMIDSIHNDSILSMPNAMSRGSAMPFQRRFTDDEVREIRQSPRSARDLAKQHGVTHATILNIRGRRSYKHVPDRSHYGPNSDHGPNNEYVTADGLLFLQTLGEGYCETVVTSGPQRRPPFSVHKHLQDQGDKGSLTDYMDRELDIITECIRVAGVSGIVLYHRRFGFAGPRRQEISSYLTRGLPLRNIIIWNHRQRLFLPLRTRRSGLPNAYDVIFMYTGRHWSMPDKSRSAAIEWGDVWDIEPEFGNLYRSNFGRPPEISAEIADRCVALGKGRVLDPFAGKGAVPLAAVRAGRDWLACDTEERYQVEFEEQHAMLRMRR